MRTLVLSLLLSGTLFADVLVLKDGTKVAGRVTDKQLHYEIQTEAGLRTYLKDEVEKVIKDPKEILGDSDKQFDEAKKEFAEAIGMADGPEKQARIKASVEKLSKARQAYAEAREHFPEEKYSDLDLKLTQIMQLMRLLRDRLGSEIAGSPSSATPAAAPAAARPAGAPAPPPAAPGAPPLAGAFAILVDPAKRNDAAQRKSARTELYWGRPENDGVHDLATAAMLFLMRTDAEWRAEGPALKALQDYFARPWLKEPHKIDPAQHLEAVSWLTGQVAELKKAQLSTASEALTLFAAGHLGHVPDGPEREKAARALGLAVNEKIVGTAEGLAVRDMRSWIESGDFDLAILAFVKEHRSTDTPAVRFVWSWAILRQVEKKQRGFDRPAGHLEAIKTTDAAVRDHAAALAKSIKAVANCSSCGGASKFRCTNCQGKKEIKFPCDKCDGKGYKRNFDGGFFYNDIPCMPCKRSGIVKLLKCTKCTNGFFDCQKCEKPKAAPSLDQICATSPCPMCAGRGSPFRRLAWTCSACLGLGARVTPAADASKVLPAMVDDTPGSPAPKPAAGPSNPAASAAGAEMNVLVLIDPLKDAVCGLWKLDGDKLVSPLLADFTRIQIPYAPPEEYDLTVKVERKSAAQGLALGLVGGGRPFVVAFDDRLVEGGADMPQVTTVRSIGGKSDNETTYRQQVLKDGVPATIVCSVRRNSLIVTVNDRKIIDWKADFSKVSCPPSWAVIDSKALFVGSYNCAYEFSDIRVKPVAGDGKKLR